jgi:hypothetical protein
MRIAVLSDTHGNSIALDAMLADVERRGNFISAVKKELTAAQIKSRIPLQDHPYGTL